MNAINAISNFSFSFQSPQTPRSFDHQSPTATGSGHQSPAGGHVHMRTPVHKPNDQMAGQLRNSPSPYSSPNTQSQENNRQLRDLLQQQPQQSPANTFRQPLPPGMIGRPQQRFMGPHPPPSASHHHQQQVKSVVSVQNTQIAASVAASESMSNQIVSAQATSTTISSTMVNTASNNEPMVGGIVVASAQQSTGSEQAPPPTSSSAPSSSSSTQQPPQQMGDSFIGNLETKLNHADLEKLEEVGDILGDLGEDDDDEFLKTFTADMGVDFNILEYAESEFDALDEAEQSNLLDSLDFDDTEEKEKSKRTKATENKAAAINQLKTNLQQHAEQSAAAAAAAASAATASNTMTAGVTQAQTTLSNQPIASSQHHPRQAPSSQAQQQIMMQQRYDEHSA